MTALVTADLHLNDLPRDEYRWQAVEVIRRYADKVGANKIFLLGDITDEKDQHSSVLVNRIVDMLVNFTQQYCEIYVLLGNHDAIDPANPFFAFIDKFDGLHFIRETEVIQMPKIKGDGYDTWYNLALIPNGQWSVPQPDCQMIFTHATFRGARSESGLSLKGLDTGTDIPIFSGDVHVPQRVGRVTYVGAPSLIDFGDTYQPRILRLDDDGAMTSVKINSPGKRLVQAILFGDGGVDLPTADFRPGDIVKVKVMVADAGDATPEALASGRDRIRKWAERGKLKLHGIDIDIPKETLPRRSAEPRSDIELVRTYAAREGFDAKATLTGESIIASVARTTT